MIPENDVFIDFLKRKAGGPLNAKELMGRLNVGPDEERDFLEFLGKRVADGDAVEIKSGRFAHPQRVGLVVGKVQIHPDGYGFVIPADKDQTDIFIKPRWLKAVMNQDRVVARVDRGGPKPEGRIIRILSRAHERVVGVLSMRKFASVVPLDNRMLHEIYVPFDDLSGACDGQIVQVEITAFPTEETRPEGVVVHVLGYPEDPEVESKAIALKHGIILEFSDQALKEAEKAPASIRPSDLREREDLRSLPFVTIDGEKAKDFDDAVCIEPMEDGRSKLWVAIADVSSYVKEGSTLDAEAYARGTSTYFPDRVFPMLPERLSNGICSLNPDVDRLTMTAEIIFNREGKRVESRFYPSVIKSRHRLTYSLVAKILDDPSVAPKGKMDDVLPGLLRMGELAKAIRKGRMERGSIDFDLPEAEIILDLQGRPEDIVKSERNWAHFLIEEFMISANEAAAEFLTAQGMPCTFRVHAPPASDRIDAFRKYVHNFGYILKGKKKLRPGDFQDLSSQIAGKPEERTINQMMLRTMSKAEYSPFNIGHFGLASEEYAHFTSPIRRYPDLILHRCLKAALKKRKPSKKWREDFRKNLEKEDCPHLSNRERASEAAERECVAWKKCQFMVDKVGTEHWGFITGVTNFGVFLELEDLFVEGLLHVSSLKNDFYHFSEELQALIGERTHTRHRIGDRLRIKVDRVDVERRQIDFTLPKEAEQKKSEVKKSAKKNFKRKKFGRKK